MVVVVGVVVGVVRAVLYAFRTLACVKKCTVNDEVLLHGKNWILHYVYKMWGPGNIRGGEGGLARRAHRITNRVLPVARVERCYALMTEYTLVAYLQSVPSPGQQST